MDCFDIGAKVHIHDLPVLQPFQVICFQLNKVLSGFFPSGIATFQLIDFSN